MYTRFKSFELITWFELRKYFIMRTPYLFVINTVDCNLVRPSMFSELWRHVVWQGEFLAPSVLSDLRHVVAKARLGKMKMQYGA